MENAQLDALMEKIARRNRDLMMATKLLTDAQKLVSDMTWDLDAMLMQYAQFRNAEEQAAAKSRADAAEQAGKEKAAKAAEEVKA